MNNKELYSLTKLAQSTEPIPPNRDFEDWVAREDAQIDELRDVYPQLRDKPRSHFAPKTPVTTSNEPFRFSMNAPPDTGHYPVGHNPHYSGFKNSIQRAFSADQGGPGGSIGRLAKHLGKGAWGDTGRGVRFMGGNQGEPDPFGEESLLGSTVDLIQNLKPAQYNYDSGSFSSPLADTVSNAWNNPKGGGAYDLGLMLAPALGAVRGSRVPSNSKFPTTASDSLIKDLSSATDKMKSTASESGIVPTHSGGYSLKPNFRLPAENIGGLAGLIRSSGNRVAPKRRLRKPGPPDVNNWWKPKESPSFGSAADAVNFPGQYYQGRGSQVSQSKGQSLLDVIGFSKNNPSRIPPLNQ